MVVAVYIILYRAIARYTFIRFHLSIFAALLLFQSDTDNATKSLSRSFANDFSENLSCFVNVCGKSTNSILLEVSFINCDSKKIEFVSSRLAKSNIESFKPYERPKQPADGYYRLAFGRSPVHTHGRTQNNPVLSEIMPENQLWINATEAAKLGIANGDRVQVTSSDGSHSGTIHAFVTEFIHPESVFMVHGFGRKVPWQTRGYNKGLGDYRFETGLLDVYDPVGGANALMECFVKVEQAN